MLEGSTETIQLPDKNTIDLSFPCRGHKAVKFRSVVPLATRIIDAFPSK